MLKITGPGLKNGKPCRLMIIGLSHENLKRLKDGKPINADGESWDLPGTEVVIFAGETEQSMAAELADYIGPNTKVKVPPRFRN